MRAIFLTLFIFFFTVSIRAQGFTIPDSLKGKSYEEIHKQWKKTPLDTTKSLIYMRSYLRKSKQEEDKICMARAYWALSHYQKRNDFKIQYLDSSIRVSQNLNNKFFPALPYITKGGYYHLRLNFKKALDNNLLALEIAKKTNSDYYKNIAQYHIAEIKGKLGKYNEAIIGFKERISLFYDPRTMVISDTVGYLKTTLRIIDIYIKTNLLDSSYYYTKNGIKLSSKLKNLEFPNKNLYRQFVFKEGVNQFYRKNYQVAKDSILSAMPFLKNYFNRKYLVEGNLYLGKISIKLGDYYEAKKYYLKVDSIAESTGNRSIELREIYKDLANHYKKQKDLKNQLVYIEKLLKFDSIYQENYKLMDKKLLDEYDIPNAVAQKEEIIAALEVEKSTNTTQIAIISLLLALSLGGVGYYYRNQRVYKKRFLQLVAAKNIPVTTLKEQIQKDKATATISDEARDHLLQQLQQFEDKQGYLKSKINSKDLAKRFGSNSSYLSIVVNTYKQKSFSQYINDLRIDYVIKRLQTDTKFRKYTIKAIAQEIGFNTAEAFAKTFYKNTGIYPSYFIKQLESREG